MLLQKIYRYARNTPERNAIVYNGRPLSWQLFAQHIDASRRYFLAQDLPQTGIAALAFGSLLDFWRLSLAAQSIGLTTRAVPSVEGIARLGPHVQCVITTEAVDWSRLHQICRDAERRLIQVPNSIYSAAAVPAMPIVQGSTGGHILLTSGTTGVYKEVRIDAAQQPDIAAFHQDILGFDESSVVNLQHFGGWTSIGYYFSISALAAGATIVIHNQPQQLYESFRYSGITHAFATPKMLTVLLQAPANALQRNDAMRFFVGGGAVSQAMATELRARLTQQLVTLIGSTEGAVITRTPIEKPDDLRWHRILPSREVQIVDNHDRIMPADQEGIVRLRPLKGVSGYLGDPAATRACFRDGYFYPGDLGIISRDGRLALHGRVSDVINVLGNKVAAGPVEETLQHELGIDGVCILSAQGMDGEERIHVVMESSQRFVPARLAEILGRLLRVSGRAQAHYVAALPRNHMGKVQRDALRRQLGIATWRD